MEKQNNNKGVVTLLILIIVILGTLCVLFATGTISFNTNKANDSDINDSNQTNSNNNIETNTSGNNDVFKTLVGTYKKTTHSDACGDSETILTIRDNGTADLYIDDACTGESRATNAIFSFNEKQIYIIDKTCKMSGENCSIGGGCYSGGCQPLWTFGYKIDENKVTIDDFVKQ